MYDSPLSLQEVCVEYICENLEALCETAYIKSDDPQNPFMYERLSFKDKDIFFHSEISEQLLTSLSEKHKLTDLTMTLFDPKKTRLRYVLFIYSN